MLEIIIIITCKKYLVGREIKLYVKVESSSKSSASDKLSRFSIWGTCWAVG